MRILLTGVTGQVGWELQRSLLSLGEVVAVGRSVANRNLQVDLAQPESIRSLVREVKPNVIVNAAAYTAVDRAEAEPELAKAVNTIAPGVLAEEAKALGAVLIHYSTDYVFNGSKSTPYTEQDQPAPQNVYGRTKLAGEEAVAAAGIQYLILRTSWVYGLRGKNFLLTMLKLAQEREEIRVVDDQIGSPTWSRLIAETTAQILSQAKGMGAANFLADKSGIYHLSNSGNTSWYGFAKAILTPQLVSGNCRLQRLVPISSEQYPTPAQRPAYSLLSTQKLADTFRLFPPDWCKTLNLVLDAV